MPSGLPRRLQANLRTRTDCSRTFYVGTPGEAVEKGAELFGQLREELYNTQILSTDSQAYNQLVVTPATGTGTPTNELMRHLLLLTILQKSFGFDITPFLVATYLLNSASMLVPFAMPHIVRSKAKTATAILGANVALALA